MDDNIAEKREEAIAELNAALAELEGGEGRGVAVAELDCAIQSVVKQPQKVCVVPLEQELFGADFVTH